MAPNSHCLRSFRNLCRLETWEDQFNTNDIDLTVSCDVLVYLRPTGSLCLNSVNVAVSPRARVDTALSPTSGAATLKRDVVKIPLTNSWGMFPKVSKRGSVTAQ